MRNLTIKMLAVTAILFATPVLAGESVHTRDLFINEQALTHSDSKVKQSLHVECASCEAGHCYSGDQPAVKNVNPARESSLSGRL